MIDRLAPLAFLLAATILPAGEVYEQPVERVESVSALGDLAVPAEPDTQRAKAADVDYTKGPKAKWIWGAKDSSGNWYLTKSFEGGTFEGAYLVATCDNVMTVWLNGKQVASSSEWQQPVAVDVSKHLQSGENTLVVKADNQGGQAGFAAKLVVATKSGKPRYVVSDASWKAGATKNAEKTSAAAVVGTMGDKPWGNVFANPGGGAGAVAGSVPRGVFQTLPGFQVEKLFDVPKNELGSWVNITTDDKGRLIVSDQGSKGLCRITPAPIGSDETTKVEHLDVKISGCQGLLWAFGKLYCVCNGGPGSGLYTVEDTDGDDQLDKVTRLKALQGGGEHGPHAVLLSPDGKSLYVIAGNHTNPPADFDASRIPSNWSEDLLLPRQWDARGHARGKLAPGGWIAKTDPDGKTWEMVSVGYRNPFDMAFNRDGELFAYDADMEWDMGSPWYRPTRVVHATSGSEFGWRSGTGKWPTWYADSLPPVVDVGPGSPVGVTFGYGAKFPAKYQNALYLLDWTFGTIYAIHLTPDGSTYVGEKEEFLSRTPLPLTDATVGADGALYFAIGGRGTQSALFRVTYVGDEPTEPAGEEEIELPRIHRRELAKLHSPNSARGPEMEMIWKSLDDEDRFVRYAARVALEHQPVDAWREQVFSAKKPDALIQSAIALAREGTETDQPKLVAALNGLNPAELTPRQRLDLLRAYALTFIRLGEPDAATKATLVEKLDPLYPAKGDLARELNRELARMLVYVESPTIVTKALAEMKKPYERSQPELGELLTRNGRYGGTIAKMLANQPELENVHLALVLRNVKYGWTLEQRLEYVQWIEKAKGWSGGASYTGFLDNVKKEALANATEAERKAIAAGVVAYRPPSLDELPKPKGPGRDWTVEDLLGMTADGLSGRDYENGRRAFAAAQCIRCHRFGGEGGATGPDLTNLAGRFSRKDLAEAIIEPSKVISDQYAASIVLDVDGKQYVGRLLDQTDEKITILVDPVDATKVVELAKDDVEEILPSKTSLMPKDLVDTLGKEEVLDLLAYLYSRGNPNDSMFAEK